MDLAGAVPFYSPDHPLFWSYFRPVWTPWITDAERARHGWAAVCSAAAESECLWLMERARAQSAGVTRVEFEHAATFLGRRGPTMRFVFVLVPPTR